MGDVEKRESVRLTPRKPEGMKPVPIMTTVRNGKKAKRNNAKNNPARR